MMAQRVNITDRAHRYRAQQNVTGPKKCVLCGSTRNLGVMHLDGNESHGEPANLAWGCKSCNGKLAAAFKRAGKGRPTNQYNPAKDGIPTFAQYAWAVSQNGRNHNGLHDDAGAIIHATPVKLRSEYAKRMAGGKRTRARARDDERWNPWPFSKGRSARDTTPASGGIAHHSKAGHAAEAAGRAEYRRVTGQRPEPRYKGYTISKTADGEYYSSLDPRSWFETKAQAKAHIDRYQKGRGNPSNGVHATYKIAHAAGQDEGNRHMKKAGRTAWNESDYNAAAKTFNRLMGEPSGRGKQSEQYRLFNPAAASAEVYEEFHGTPSREVVTLKKRIHTHAHLASLGTLKRLLVLGVDGQRHNIEGFKKAILCCNEDKNQLFIEGGDQSINLEDFGIRKPHERERLGRILVIDYHTDKKHLGDEGGDATYTHEFCTTNKGGKHVKVAGARYPTLDYDVVNEQLLISGGSYTIRAEGIDV